MGDVADVKEALFLRSHPLHIAYITHDHVVCKRYVKKETAGNAESGVTSIQGLNYSYRQR
jgi:hypothetical protein